jgi:hypothetical protein
MTLASVPDGFVELGKEILVIVVVSLIGQYTELERQGVAYAKLFSIDIPNRWKLCQKDLESAIYWEHF